MSIGRIDSFISKNISPNIGDENLINLFTSLTSFPSKNISPNIGDENDR